MKRPYEWPPPPPPGSRAEPPSPDCYRCAGKGQVRRWPWFWLKQKCPDCPVDIKHGIPPGVPRFHVFATTPPPWKRIVSTPAAPASKQGERDNSGDFLAGVVVGEMLSETRNAEPAIAAPEPIQPGGGEFGGAGTSDSWNSGGGSDPGSTNNNE